jgi:hypothetical protein
MLLEGTFVRPARSIGFMNAGIADPEVRKKKLNAE